MQTEREKPDYPLPRDLGLITSLVIDDRERMGGYIQIALISADLMVHLRAKDESMLGMPVNASIMGDRLWLHPTPDGVYNIIARYCPAEREF